MALTIVVIISFSVFLCMLTYSLVFVTFQAVRGACTLGALLALYGANMLKRLHAIVVRRVNELRNCIGKILGRFPAGLIH